VPAYFLDSSALAKLYHTEIGSDVIEELVLSSGGSVLKLPEPRAHVIAKPLNTEGDCIRPRVPLSLEDGRRLVQGYVDYYNNARLNSAIGYITPKDMLAGRQQEIHAEWDRKLEAARQQRCSRRRQAA
jgi:hypothetical protein